MIIIGIDTAIRKTGYGVIDMRTGGSIRILDCGLIRNAPSLPHSECLRRLAGGIRELVSSFKPEAAAIESAFVSRNVKTAMILDGALFERLESAAERLYALSDAAAVTEAVARCCELKAEVVASDEKESGRRAILNYGHTFGHALEAVTGYSAFEHGEAVAVGMCMAADLAVSEKLISAEEAERQEKLLKAFHLPVNAAGRGLSSEKLLQAMMHDKKPSSGKIKVVLPVRIGHADVFRDLPADRLEEALCGRI